MTFVRVALDVPLNTLFDYQLDGGTPGLIGARVLVPFGRGQRAGVIVEVGGEPQVALSRIKAVAQVFQQEPSLPADVMQLTRFASRYYRHPLGQVIMNVLPQPLRRARAPREPAARLCLSDAALAADWAMLPPRAVARRRVLDHLRAHGAREPAELRSLSGTVGRALKELVAQGWVIPEISSGALPAAHVSSSGPILTLDQRAAVGAIGDTLDRFAAWLLLGVTGSGKTEVYLHLIDRLLTLDRQALVIVPEINLTPQLEATFAARFAGLSLVSLHSNVSEAERLRRWRAAESGEARIVIGTRLSVFTPMPNLGLIVVDEEHDASLKQQDGLRYSARDLAVLRAKHRGVPIVLGSATPSLETYSNAVAGRYRLAQLPSRANSQLPLIRCVDTRKQKLREGLSQTLIEALRQRLSREEQSLLFVNRRGFAPALLCFSCGWSAKCTRCSARLVLHVQKVSLRCHYCGHQEPVPHACPSCGNQDLSPAGHGTQRLENVLAEAFPQARVLRVDRDSVRRKDAFEQMRQRVHEHDVDILVGTQMLAKGHDFPRMTLVGVVNADAALYSTDFRAAEKLFAQLTQVAGRAGRGTVPGEVLIQTNFPDHPLYEAVRRQDYASFAETALAERREAGFPPFAYQALLRAEAKDRDVVDRFLGQAAQAARRIVSKVEVYEPVPAPIARVAGRERGHLLVQSAAREDLQRFLDDWEPQLSTADSSKVRWALDIDPLDL